tara:strand:- start:601 stop:807 length:207 start_codon:yes stop_codon:yes gene_type:complete
MKREHQQQIRLVFKCGYTHDFWVKDLLQDETGQFTWEHLYDDNQILDFSPDDIACLIQVGMRTRFVRD